MSFRTHVTTGIITWPDKQSLSSMTNMDMDNSGILRPRKSWETFGGMVYQLWLLNKKYKRLGIVGDFTVRFPLPRGSYKGK
jgi:hypothetical protein